VNLESRIERLEEHAPKETCWHLAGGGEFRSPLTVLESISLGKQQLVRGGEHPIYDAAHRTIRSEDGSRLHELWIAVRQPPLKKKRKRKRVSRVNRRRG
jgi:hypothetical protein